MKKYYYIYDIKQANYYLQEGIELVEVGTGLKGDAYFKFVRDKHTEEVFAYWVDNREAIVTKMYK